MTDKIHHVGDSVLAFLSTVAVGVGTLVLAAVTPLQKAEQVWELVLPFLGGLVPMWSAILLNPEKETRSIVIGRGLFALFVATMGPSVMIVLLPESWSSYSEIMRWPACLLFMGGGTCFLTYILSKPFCRKLYERADAISAAQVRRLEEKFGVKTDPSSPNPPQ